VRDGDFPQPLLVHRLAQGIADECLAKSLESNASLGGGANAFAIPQDAFDTIIQTHPLLASALKFGVAYNAFALVPNHGTKSAAGDPTAGRPPKPVFAGPGDPSSSSRHSAAR
jgi:hypothetical protein